MKLILLLLLIVSVSACPLCEDCQTHTWIGVEVIRVDVSQLSTVTGLAVTASSVEDKFSVLVQDSLLYERYLQEPHINFIAPLSQVEPTLCVDKQMDTVALADEHNSVYILFKCNNILLPCTARIKASVIGIPSIPLTSRQNIIIFVIVSILFLLITVVVCIYCAVSKLMNCCCGEEHRYIYIIQQPVVITTELTEC